MSQQLFESDASSSHPSEMGKGVSRPRSSGTNSPPQGRLPAAGGKHTVRAKKLEAEQAPESPDRHVAKK